MEQYLRLVTSTSPEAWTDWISIATAIHNNRRNATTKLSPNQILLGYETTLIPTGTGESTNEATERRLETMIKKRLAAIDAINHVAKARAPIPSQYKIGKFGSRRPTLSSDIRRPNSPQNVMDPSGSSKRFPPLPIKFNCPRHGAYMTCSTPPSFRHIKKPQHTDPTSPDHHLI